MKQKYLIISVFVVVVTGLSMLLLNVNGDNKALYTPRQDIKTPAQSAGGAIEYLRFLRANPETGTVDLNDVRKAQSQAKQLLKLKSGQGAWEFIGPDNIGGRTRAILIDNENSDIMYSGGVSGGLWRSTTKGQYWEQVGGNFDNIAVSCISQAPNGDIYFGTGEGFLSYPGMKPDGDGGSGMAGKGIYKSTDRGETFSMLASTSEFNIVYEVACDPTNENIVYAGTLKGLLVSNDAGKTWANVETDEEKFNISYGYDIQVASNGAAVASIRNYCFVKKAGETIFKLRSSDDETKKWIHASNIGRMEFAIAPQDDNYIYCVAAVGSGVPNSKLRNIYRSTDGGDTWVVIGKGGSDLFQPLGGQGCYDMTIAVNPQNKDHVIVAGLDVYSGSAVHSGDLFSWSQMTFWSLPAWYQNYVHADQHVIVFDKKQPDVFYIGSDGGISRGYFGRDGIDVQFTTLNKNFNITQFYGIAVNGVGQFLGGTQDNGSILVDGKGNTPKSGFDVWGGDGGHTEMSTIYPTLAFATLYYGGLKRNIDANYEDWNTFYSPNLAQIHWKGPNYVSDPSQGAFVTPIAYWETDNDELSDDVAWIECQKAFKKDTVLNLGSFNITGAPIKVKLTQDYSKGDTIYYDDPYSSLFALGMTRAIWITRSASNFTKGQLTDKDWWCATKRSLFSSGETVTQIKFSADGNHCFFATNFSNLFRLSNLNEARDEESGAAAVGNKLEDNPLVKTNVTKIANFGGRAITGLAVDEFNVDNLIVTLGNYGYNDFIHLCTTASSCMESESKVHFTDITANLPKAPTYCAIIDISSSQGRVLVGTEFGVYSANNVIGGDIQKISWTTFNEGLGPVPVFEMRQQTKGWPWSKLKGEIYIGTHGLGAFKNSSFLTGVNNDTDSGLKNSDNDINVVVYPNPVKTTATVNFTIKTDSRITISVYNLSGVLVNNISQKQYYKGDNQVTVDMSQYVEGTYLVRVSDGVNYITKQVIKK